MQTTIALPVGELRPALIGLGKVISKSSTLPVLSTVRITRDSEGWVHLIGTDLDTFVSVRLEQPCPGDPVSALVPLTELGKVIKTQPNGDAIELLVGEDGTSLRYPVGRQHVTTRVEDIPDREFPEIPVITGQSVSLEDPVRSALLEAMQCASSDQTRYVLNGVFLDAAAKTGHYVIGTDGRHLYSANSFQLPLPAPVIVPDRKFLAWKPFQADGQWTLTQSPEKPAKDEVPWLRIASRRWALITRGIDGTFPNYKQVIPAPETFKTCVELGEEGAVALLDVIRRLPGEERPDAPVTLHVVGGTFSISGRNADDSMPECVCIEGVAIKGPDVIIGVNRNYLAKALRFGLSTVQFIDAQSPMRFSKDGRQVIVMPLRIAETAPVYNSQPPAPAEPVAETTTTAPPEPQPERNPMPETNGASRSITPANPSAGDSTDKPALEVALEKLDLFKTSLRETLAGANELSSLLRQAVREQRSGAKEIQTVRQTLRSLQSVKF